MLESAGINTEFPRRQVHDARHAEHIQVRYYLGAKRNVDKGGQNDGQEGGDEVHHKRLLRVGKVIVILRAIVLVVGQASCDGSQYVGDSW